MKVNGNGQAAVLTPEQIRILFSEGFNCSRDRALYGICLYTACRISEALHLHKTDVTATRILFRKANTKGKIVSREVRVVPALTFILSNYHPDGDYLFPGCDGNVVLGRNAADKNLKNACKKLGLVGISTHSFRRTALTTMHDAGIPLRTIQKISGHRSLEQLAAYLEVSDQQLYRAALVLNF